MCDRPTRLLFVLPFYNISVLIIKFLKLKAFVHLLVGEKVQVQ